MLFLEMQMTDSAQATLWNGSAANAWVANQAMLDQMFYPFEALLTGGLLPGQRVLDVGCGTGATTLAAARRAGHCTGADISAPMIAVARERAAAAGLDAAFLCADVQDHAFAPQEFDAVISRFGVMFFTNPIAAFTNLHRAARPGATLHLYAWRSPDENPFMTTAERAAAPLVTLPPMAPGQPGQFAFADSARVREILGHGGWGDIDIAPVDVPCSFPASGMLHYLTRMGPLGRILPTLGEQEREHVIATVHAAFAPFVRGDTVHFSAACWEVRARADVIRG
jgi:SAM-dependent methyltransferase